MARARDLAGLAALGFLGYKLFGPKGKGKDEDSTPTRAARPESTETRLESPQDTIKRSMKKAPLDDTDKYPSGVMGGDSQSDAPVTRSVKAKPTPKSDKNEDFSNEGRTPAKGSSASPTYMSKTPAGDKKRTEGNEPMPSLKAVESRAASNKTDAMRNASRANVSGANRQKAMKANPEAQAAERVYPEELLVGGPGVKVVGAAAKNLANRGAKEVVEYSTPRLAAPAKQLTGPSKAELMARDRAAREAARQEQMLKENAANYGLNPKAPGYDAAASSLRKNIGGDDFTIMKKGGMTKMASGGMTASRRGDGIASRGKTRGKIC